MFVHVGGVPGVGKTTVIAKTVKLAQEREIRVEEINGASILCSLAGVDTIVELRALPESVRRGLRPELNRRLYEIDRRDLQTIRLIDGHFVFFETKGKEYGIREIQPWDKEQTIAIAVIVANPRTILNRRLKAVTSRPDRQQDLNFLIREQNMEIQVAGTQAKELDIPICLLSNEDVENLTAPEKLLSFCIDQDDA